jgi:large subunit ribosomal protein L23
MILIKPLISEKSLSLAAKKKYTFRVNITATKEEIKKEAERIFGVKVICVKTSIQHGKEYRTGRKWTTARKADWKKAIISIQPDKQIDLFEVTQTEK